MLLWLNGLTSAVPFKTVLDTLIDEYQTKPVDLTKFLDQDEFLIQLKDAKPRVLDFLHKQRLPLVQQMVQIIISECTEIQEYNYNHFIRYPVIINELMALSFPQLTQIFFEDQIGNILLEQLFSLLDRNGEVPEPQLAHFVQFVQVLLTINPHAICEFIYRQRLNRKTLIIQCLNHIYSAQITNLMIQFLNPENTKSLVNVEDKCVLLKYLVNGFFKLDPNEVLNAMVVCHEVMTRFLGMEQTQGMVTYLVSYEVISKMFEVLKVNQSIYHCKASAHILSLISNYYSYSMQNITIFTLDQGDNPELEYHQQLTVQFEQSDFMKCFSENLNVFTNILTVALQGKQGVIVFKIIEITDNLIRISNIKLWIIMKEQGFIQKILDLYFHFPKSNIIHNLTEKMLQYALNRAVSDFHPFWAVEMFITTDVIGLINKQLEKGITPLQLLNNFQWFSQELLHKVKLPLGSHRKLLLTIYDYAFNDNAKWQNCVQALHDWNIMLDSRDSTPASSEEGDPKQSDIPQPLSHPKTINMGVQIQPLVHIQTQGDEPAEFDECTDEFPSLPPNTLQQNIHKYAVKCNTIEVEEKEETNEVIHEDSIPTSPMNHNKIDRLNSFESADSPNQEFKLPTTPLKRLSAMEGSLKLKQLDSELVAEFEVSENNQTNERVLMRNNKVLMVDELDSFAEKQESLSQNSEIQDDIDNLEIVKQEKFEQLQQDQKVQLDYLEKEQRQQQKQLEKLEIMKQIQLSEINEQKSTNGDKDNNQILEKQEQIEKEDQTMKQQTIRNLNKETINELFKQNTAEKQNIFENDDIKEIPYYNVTIAQQYQSITNFSATELVENKEPVVNEFDYCLDMPVRESNILDSSMCSLNSMSSSKRVRVVFNQSLNKIDLLVDNSEVFDRSYSERSSINSVDMSLNASFFSVGGTKRFRQIQPKDKKFLEFMKSVPKTSQLY